MKIEQVQTAKLIPYASNARLHNEAQVAQIAASIKEFGFCNPVLVDAEAVVIAGHGRVLAARMLDLKTCPCIRLAHLTEAQRKAYRIADNRLAETGGGWDAELLRIEIADLADRLNFNVSLLGFTDAELSELENAVPDFERTANGMVSERFLYPPFTVLDARCGWWQERKNSWIDRGIDSGTGRDEDLLFKSGIVKQSVTVHSEVNRRNGSSIFDPVLTELAYRWFVPPGGSVIDPFAGGSVRGIIASVLKLDYMGFDIRAEQIAANKAQFARLNPCDFDQRELRLPRWHCSDCRDFLTPATGQFDFLFSCPPYGDLEKYSDAPGDLSNMLPDDFSTAYRAIIAACADRLKPDRFACFVVGDYRERNQSGYYRDFVSATIDAFRASGLRLYNEAILVTQAGSLPLRIGHHFCVSRKLGKTHQNVLVFCNGDPRAAAVACGPVEVTECFPNFTPPVTVTVTDAAETAPAHA